MAATAGWRGEGEDVGRETRQVFEAVGGPGGGAARAGGGPGGPVGPLIVTEDPVLLDDLLRLCAAAGARPLVLPTLPERRGEWEAAPLVLVGDDAAARMERAPRRPGVLLVGRDQGEPAVWQWAVRIGAEHVLRLPDAEAWLVDRIADVVEGAGRSARTVGVVGGRGGAGASTLACALAVTAAAGGSRTVLVDADPIGVRAGSSESPARGISASRQVNGLQDGTFPISRILRVVDGIYA